MKRALQRVMQRSLIKCVHMLFEIQCVFHRVGIVVPLVVVLYRDVPG